MPNGFETWEWCQMAKVYTELTYEWQLINSEWKLVRTHEKSYEAASYSFQRTCGGAPAGQQALAQAQTAEYTQETQQQAELFSQEQALQTEIQSVYGPIFAAGPSQLGFSQAELSALNSGAATGVGQSFQAANQAVKENIASSGGGNVQLPSGVLTKAEMGMGTAGAAQLSGEQSQILQSDYAAGNANFMAATNALLNSGQIFNPGAAYGGVANQGGAAANTTWNNIAMENEAPFGAVMGALGGVAGAVISENPKGIFN